MLSHWCFFLNTARRRRRRMRKAFARPPPQRTPKKKDKKKKKKEKKTQSQTITDRPCKTEKKSLYSLFFSILVYIYKNLVSAS